MIKLVLIPFTFFFSLTIFAASETVKNYDLDKNQKDDRFEYFLKDKLVRVEEDLNNDGKIDFKTSYNLNPYFIVTEQDTNFDGKFERKQSKKYVEKKQIQIITEVDNDRNGKYDISYSETVNSEQKQAERDCYEEVVNQSIENLVNGGFEALEKLDNGFLTTDFGYTIDGGCLKRWGNQFLGITKKTIQTGMKCLLRLQKENAKGGEITGALRNAYKLSDYVDNNSTTIICGQENYNWTKTAGHASTNSAHNLSEPKVNHPYISINPNYPKINKKANKDELHEIGKTIFHEQMHTLGFRHEENIEYAYACEDCCLDKRMTKKEKILACKICTGNYVNEADKNYVKDIVFYSRSINQDYLGIASALRYLKENPKDLSGAGFFSYAIGNIYNPVAPEFAQILLDRNKVFTEEQLDLVHEGGTYEGSDIFQKSKESARIVAIGIYEIYINNNKDGALQLFEKYQESLKKIITTKSDDSKNTKKVAAQIKNMLQLALRDIWLNARPVNKTATKAYQLYEFFNK